MTFHYKITKFMIVRAYLLNILTKIWKILTYFSKQSRFDRKTTAEALKHTAAANKAMEKYWADKRKKGSLRIHHAGVVQSDVPFPAKGSLLTDEERADLSRSVVPVRQDTN